MDVFLINSLRKLCLWRQNFTFWAGVRGTLPFNTLRQHSDNEQIMSLSHFLIISLLLLPTQCFKRNSKGREHSEPFASTVHGWMIVRIRLSRYLLLSKINILHISGKIPVLSLSLSSVSCFRSIKMYQYRALVAFLNASIMNALLPGYIWRAWLATWAASRAFLNRTM